MSATVVPVRAAAEAAGDSRCVAWIFTAALAALAVAVIRWCR